ncbi:MAG TPA: helix-turn-helix domain-containing protein [Spirochaetia bacterium]|nr:helix-turn-helix domain-containing protein [Spirochaetia bacterium]
MSTQIQVPETPAQNPQGKISEYCELYAQLMDLLSRRWTGLILRVLLSGPHRFNQILAAIPGLSDPLLTQRLREMEAKGILRRHVVPESPVRVEYDLTEAGHDLERAVRALSDWASRWWADAEHEKEGPA